MHIGWLFGFLWIAFPLHALHPVSGIGSFFGRSFLHIKDIILLSGVLLLKLFCWHSFLTRIEIWSR